MIRIRGTTFKAALTLLLVLSELGSFRLIAEAKPIPRAPLIPVRAQVEAVDLRDLAEFRRDEFPGIKLLVQAMTRKTKDFFPEGVKFWKSGPTHKFLTKPGKKPWITKFTQNSRRTRPAHPTRYNSVYGVELTEPPHTRADGAEEYSLVAHYHSKKTGFNFRRMKVLQQQGQFEVQVIDDIPIEKTLWRGDASLIDRKLVMTELNFGFKKVYPIGVGSFDEGVTKNSKGRTVLLTPIFRNGSLRRGTSMEARFDPQYFEGMPFVRVMPESGKSSEIGFHVLQGRGMTRGFYSHGCMRLRPKDLYELYETLMHHGAKSINVNIVLKIDSKLDHPFPLVNEKFKYVVNGGTPEAPKTVADKDNPDLTLTAIRQSPPPTHLLVPMDSSELSDLQFLNEETFEPSEDDWMFEDDSPDEGMG